MSDTLSDTLSFLLTADDLQNALGSPANITDALFVGLTKIAAQLRGLGLADAATPFGAIEALCVEMKKSSQRIADGLHAIADAIEGHS